MTEELASAYESLGAVFRFSADLLTGGPHDTFIRKWMGELLGIAGADWYVFRLVDAAQTELRLESSFPPGRTAPPLVAARAAAVTCGSPRHPPTLRCLVRCR